MCEQILVSNLAKTWILDIDGTLVKHNGYRIDGYDTLLPRIENLLSQIRPEDMVILVTSRTEEYRRQTEQFFQDNHIRYDSIIFNAPYGERILINDAKLSGLKMAYAVNTVRDCVGQIKLKIDDTL